MSNNKISNTPSPWSTEKLGTTQLKSAMPQEKTQSKMEAEDLQASDVVTAWSIKLASSDPENHLAQTV